MTYLKQQYMDNYLFNFKVSLQYQIGFCKLDLGYINVTQVQFGLA